MTQLRLIGYWIESLSDTKYFAPQDFVRALDESQKERLTRYLRQGTTFEAYRGYSWCRFYCGVGGVEMGNSELTDGHWLWPSGLVHYVAHHDVALPDEFISHVLAGGSRSSHGDALPKHTDDWWCTWCTGHSSGVLRGHLDDARARAAVFQHEEREKWLRLLEKKNGVSERPCDSIGCEQRAMHGWALCGRCNLNVGGLGEFGGTHELELERLEQGLLRDALTTRDPIQHPPPVRGTSPKRRASSTPQKRDER